MDSVVPRMSEPAMGTVVRSMEWSVLGAMCSAGVRAVFCSDACGVASGFGVSDLDAAERAEDGLSWEPGWGGRKPRGSPGMSWVGPGTVLGASWVVRLESDSGRERVSPGSGARRVDGAARSDGTAGRAVTAGVGTAVNVAPGGETLDGVGGDTGRVACVV